MIGSDASASLRQRNLASASRLRWIFLALAVALPLLLGSLFSRQNQRLQALADHGQAITATVIRISRSNAVDYTEYRYDVGGASYDWSVTRRDAPFAVGERFTITVLPEHPSLSRPGAYSPVRAAAEIDLRFQRALLLGLFLFFALFAAWCERTVRKLRAGEDVVGRRISPEAMGRAIAVLILGALLLTNLDAKVVAVQVAAFGRTRLGLPITLVVALAQLVLFVPYFWVFPHLMRIVSSAAARGASMSKTGVVLAVARAGPEHRRSRTIAILGLAYFILLMAAWIAFAESRGL